MKVYRTVDVDGVLRLEEEGGSSITLIQEKDIARILSLFVSAEGRETGKGRRLIQAAEQEVYARGIRRIEADFSGEIRGLDTFLGHLGYEVRTETEILLMKTADVLASEKVHGFVKRELHHVRFMPLGELDVAQRDALLAFLHQLSVCMDAEDIRRFSKEIGGVALDANKKPQSLMFCTEDAGRRGRVHIDFLASREKKGGIYTAAVMQGFLRKLAAEDAAGKYREVSALVTEESVRELLESLLEGTMQTAGAALHAVRELADGAALDDGGNIPDGGVLDGSALLEIQEESDVSRRNEWKREIARFPMQGNIGWKMAWHRGRMG